MRRAARTQARHSERLSCANPSVVAPRRTRVSSHRRSAPPLRDAAAAIMTKHRVGLPLSPLPPLTGPSEASVVAASPRSFGALLLLPRARARSLTRAWEVRSIQLRFLTAPRGFHALFTMVRVVVWGASRSLRMTWHIRTDSPLTASAARRPSSTRCSRCGSFSGRRLTLPSHNKECVSPFTRRALRSRNGSFGKTVVRARGLCCPPFTAKL